MSARKEYTVEFVRQNGDKIAVTYHGKPSIEEVLGKPLLNAIKMWSVLDQPEALEELKEFAGYDPDEAIPI